jgi:small subunit ribosomal protein S1
MSDTDKPASPPPPAEPAAAEPHRRGFRPEREKSQRSQQNAGRVPSLEDELRYGGGRKIEAFDEDLEQQLEEAMGGLSAKDLLDAPPGQKRPKPAPGGKQKGKVFRIHGEDVFIEMPGGRTQGVLPISQFTEGPPTIGDEVEVHIQGFDRDGVLLLSREGAAIDADWDSVAQGQLVEARVTATNKGGLSVDVNGIRGFMPVSQIDLYRVEDLEQYVNQRLRCLVTEVDREERNLVVSRRALLEKEREEGRERLWQELAEGQIREGVVRSIMAFGAFVDLGGADGLLHVSEMSWTRVKSAADVVQPGQKVKVVVLKVDHERRKLSLGMKQLMKSPWDEAVEKFPPGTLVNGTVTRAMDFGAFVELEPGVEGLIHISELAPQRVRRVVDVVKPGQAVQVMVLNVDPAQRRISLSLKAAKVEAPEAEAAEEDEAAEEAPKPRPRTTPLRGGVGNREVSLPQEEEDEE